MTGCIRSYLASGVVVFGAGALVLTSAASRDPLPRAEQPAVALTAQVQPLPAPTTVATLAPTGPLELAGQQVNFHVGLLVDFIVTGAQLVARQVPVPGTLLQDIQNGTPLPVAVGRALQTLVDVEIDAGRELVGYAAQYVDFQVRFLAELIALPFAVVAAVGEFVGSFFAAVTPQPVVEPSLQTQTVSASAVSAPAVLRSDEAAIESVEDEPADTASTAEKSDEGESQRRTSVVAAPDSESATTVRAQGEVRSGAIETTDTMDADDATATARDDAAQADESDDDEQHREAVSDQADSGGADDAAQGDSSGAED